MTVEQVGRKYFNAALDSYGMSHRYRLSNWEEDAGYGARTRLYATEQEWIDEAEASKIWSDLRETFNGFPRIRFSLETLRAIRDLIEKEYE